MGQLIGQCKFDCCINNKRDRRSTRSSFHSNSDGDDNELEQIQYSRFCVTETPKATIDFPVKVKNLFFEHFSNPWTTYVELCDIGEGAYGSVKKVCLKNDPETIRAMKIIPKENIIEKEDGTKLVDEIEILKNLEHPNIMKIFECFNDKDNVYIISEFCDQGDLLGKMDKLGTLNQIVVKQLMDQILNAIAYLHTNRIFHGDIKLENVMLYKTSMRESRRFSRINKDLNKNKQLEKDIEKSFNKKFTSKRSFNYIEDMNDYEVKLIDFGCSKYLVKKKDNKLSGIVGTSIYCSPEVIDDLYDEKSDEWACGVLMYILICGEPPFQGETEEEIFANVKKGKYSFHQKEFHDVSESCKDLIKQLLEPDKNLRIKASEALKHHFFKENYDPNLTFYKNMDKQNYLNKLLEVKKLPSKFHELIEAYLCFNFIKKDEEKKLTQVFRYLDHRGKNRLSFYDFNKTFKENGINVSKQQIQNMIDIIDSDGNNTIEYQEFLRAMCDKDILYNDKNLESVFNSIDIDQKGYINVEDIKKFIFKNKDVADITFCNYLKQIGMDLSSKLKLDQFVDIIRNQKLFHFNKNTNEIDEKNKEDISEEEKNNDEEKPKRIKKVKIIENV
jgi:calcium-dependent protein kinase